MKRADFKKKLVEEVHAGWRGFANYIMGKAEHLPDGSIKIKKQQVDIWRRMIESTHYKLKTNEKVWANMIVDRIMNIMSSFKKNAIKSKADPRVAEIKTSFVKYCKDLRGFDPIVEHGKDGIMIKKRLTEYSEEDILDCFDWFLTEKDFEKFSPSISTALSAAIFNRFLSQR